MTKIKLCGLSRIEDIEAANTLKPDFIGFVFAAKSKRRVSHLKAAELKSKLNPETKAVGVFLDDDLDTVGALMNLGIVDMVQLHGSEDEEYIAKLRAITDKPIIKAFIINNESLQLEAARGDQAPVLSRGRTERGQRRGGSRRPSPLRGGRQHGHRNRRR